MSTIATAGHAFNRQRSFESRVAGNVCLAGKICLVGCGLVPLQNQDFKENDYHAMPCQLPGST